MPSTVQVALAGQGMACTAQFMWHGMAWHGMPCYMLHEACSMIGSQLTALTQVDRQVLLSTLLQQTQLIDWKRT